MLYLPWIFSSIIILPTNAKMLAIRSPFSVRATAVSVIGSASAVRLKFQRKGTLVDPSRISRLSAMSSVMSSDVVSTGEGSNHVMFPPSTTNQSLISINESRTRWRGPDSMVHERKIKEDHRSQI